MRSTLAILLGVAVFVSASPAQEQGAAVKVTIQDNIIVSAPPGWRVGNQTPDSVQIYVPLQKTRKFPIVGEKENPKPPFVIASEAGMLITVEHRRNHAESVRRLSEIASEYPEAAKELLIAGWPAIERTYRTLMPQPGEDEVSRGNIETSFVTTAVAGGDTVIRLNTMLAPDADPKLLEQALAIGRALRVPQGPADVSRRELEEMRRMVKPPSRWQPQQPPLPGPTASVDREGRRQPGVAIQVQAGLGELEVATNDGQNVVVAANSGFSFSSNFGATWTLGGGTPCNQTVCDGDPSLAVGKSGAIYYAWIGGTSLTALSDGISRSTNNGQTFTFQALAATCPGTTNCTSADQEHIAADRVNAAAGGGDRVYNVWRDFAPTFSIRISCSSNNATTWTSGTPIGSGDFPRVSVGGDGFVYVAWASGGNMMLHKFSSCDAGLTAQVGWPKTVAAFTNVVCPVPGLDRCNGRNILSSPKIAVDDLDANHLYYVFATSTAAGNEDIMVFDSTDGGATFPRSVRVNNPVTARRFMPWISTYGGIAVVSWYDRRNATAANNDLTRYFLGGAAVRGPNLVALAETDVSGADDNECSTWPRATNAVTDSESCSVQPQLAGRCSITTTTACDFSTPACPPGESCSIGRGAPKYGDYNGNAAGGGRMYSAWSSSVPPAAVGGAGGSIKVYASADRIPSDFYVRDWNASPNFDNGAQPSTSPIFWATSDVWNQSTNTPEAPGPDGSVPGDPPSRSGSNFAYARVSRRAPAMSTAPNATVTVNFLLGDFGLGSPFTSIGSETMTFTAGDTTQITPAHSWTVPASASSHLCLAVEISGPDGDTFASPSIAGTAPGPADPFIIADNNKAQRNLQDTVGTADGTELIAMITNSERRRRLIRLRVSVPPGIQIAGFFDVIGGRQRTAISNDGRIAIGELAPGETRWLRFRATSLAGIQKSTLIHVFEDTNPPANGFTIMLHQEELERVAQRNLRDLGGELARLAAYEESTVAKKVSALAIAASATPNRDTYLAFLADNRSALSEIIAGHLRKNGADRFEIRVAAEELWGAVDQKNATRAAAANTSLIERLDAHLTAIMLSKRKP